MELQKIFSSDLVWIQVNLEFSYLELEWLNHPSSKDFREVVTRAHAYAKQHQISKWLCNIQQADFLEAADQQWLVQCVFSDFDKRFHHDYAYLIQPMVSEVVTAYHIHDSVKQDAELSSRLNVAVFTDIDLAQQWLFTPNAQHALAI